MIDLRNLIAVLDEVDGLVQDLDGLPLDDSPTAPRKLSRDQRVEASQKLQLLAAQLELGAALVRSEYFFSRGFKDPLNPDRALGEDEPEGP